MKNAKTSVSVSLISVSNSYEIAEGGSPTRQKSFPCVLCFFKKWRTVVNTKMV
jgi:hypothetical protein